MKISELVDKLQSMKLKFGDIDVNYVDFGSEVSELEDFDYLDIESLLVREYANQEKYILIE